MSQIARSAGVTSAAIYNHFSSKDELFNAAVARMMRVNLQGYAAAAGRGESWKAKLGNILQYIAKDKGGWTRYPLIVPTVQLRLLRESHAHSELSDLRRQYLELFEAIVRSGMDEGALNPALKVSHAAALLLAFIANGIGTVMAHNNSETAIGEILEQAALLLGVRD